MNVSDEELKRNIDRYWAEATKLGATDARGLETAVIPIDDRVVLKCRVPKCFGYGNSANCPPHSLKPEEMRQVIVQYRRALVLKLEVEPGIIVRDRSTVAERVEAYKKVFELVSSVESMAFYDGHYLSVGFAAGSCKSTYCHNVDCSVLNGEKCRLSLRARPSMEAVGVDCYRLATELGWQIYPIGSDAKADSIPVGILMGLVLVD